MADVVGSLSLVADAGFGLPPEESMRVCLAATAIARRLGLSEREVSDVFYTALLEHIGCNGAAHEAAQGYGDEMDMFGAAIVTDDTLRDEVLTMLPRLLRGRSWSDRFRLLMFSMTQGSKFGRTFVASVCEVGRSAARRLRLSDGVQRGVHDVFEGWNGKGGFQDFKGEAVPVQSRVAIEPGLVLHELPVEPPDVGARLKGSLGRVAAASLPGADQGPGLVVVEVAGKCPDVEVEGHRLILPPSIRRVGVERISRRR
jgi:hypothetical protein